MRIEINWITTLRDGEQTQECRTHPLEKLHIAKASSEDLQVDRIEVASARVSAGEFEAISRLQTGQAQQISE